MSESKQISQKYSLNLKGTHLDVSIPCVMGILNVTPDSFFDGGFYKSEKDILSQTEKMLLDGAAIVDVGGYSTRPMANEISVQEEKERVLPVIKSLVNNFKNIKISVDTFRSEVAEMALDAGAVMVNDISGGQLDAKMWRILERYKPVYVLMHSRGNPQNMQNLTHYDDLLLEVMDYFQTKINELLSLGLKDLILDVGFGFAKTREQNFDLLKDFSYLQKLKFPIMVGLSRKSLVYKTLGISPEESLNGTTVLNAIALMNGANILRVHDVKEAVETIKLYRATFN